MTPDSSDLDLTRRLRESNEKELLALVEEHLEELDPPAVRAILRNPFVNRPVLERLFSRRRLLSFYEVRKDLAVHRQTPVARSLALVGTLFWRDLVNVGADTRVSPRIRRTADQRLAQRLPGLAVGERIAIARSAGPGAIARLRFDRNVRVIRGLLENPRLTEAQLLPLVNSEDAAPPVLELIAREPRWRNRYDLRLAIATNPKTPTGAALGILPLLKKKDLRDVAANRRLSGAVRRRADLLSGGAS